MELAPFPDFAEISKAHLRRSEWGQFPDAVIHAGESLVKKHPLYAAAKRGDAEENMEQSLKNGGLLPSAMALINSLNQKPAISSEPMMLTPLQLELLQQGEAEIDAYLDQSPRLSIFLIRIHSQSGNRTDAV